MKLEVRDSADNVMAEVEFVVDPGMEKRVTVHSSTGGSIHAFYETTPVITVRVPGMSEDALAGEDAPVRNVRDISEVVGPTSRPIETVPTEPETPPQPVVYEEPESVEEQREEDEESQPTTEFQIQ